MRQKLFSFINISGLAVGLTACILILMYIQYEFSYDRFNKRAKNIFLVTEKLHATDKQSDATSPWQLGPILKNNFPGITSTARVVQMSHYVSVYNEVSVASGTKQFYDQKLYYADPSIFRIFTIPLLRGNVEEGLSRPYTMVISASMARKLFGKRDPIGQMLNIQGSQDYEITGVYRDFPPNSHFHADALASFSSINSSGNQEEDWHPKVYTYLLLKNSSYAAKINNQFPLFIKRYFPVKQRDDVSLSIMPLLDIHLHSHLRFIAEPQGDIRYIYLFAGIALLILIIACFNYVNMVTARSAERARETGIKKILGASRKRLIEQYLFESLFMNMIALIVAIGLVRLLFPLFNRLTGLEISYAVINPLWTLLLLCCILLSIIILSGLYPALLLSAFRPAQVLKGKIVSFSGVDLRKGLVVFQFAISVTLIVCAIVLQRQMRYTQNHKLSPAGSTIILIRGGEGLGNAYPPFKVELMKNPDIHAVTTTNLKPGFVNTFQSFDRGDIEGNNEKVSNIPIIYGDDDFVNTLGLKIVTGRNFSNEFSSDDSQSVVINEEAAKQFGWSNPVGKYILFPEAEISGGKMKIYKQRQEVIGVVKDFHYQSLRKEITPVIIEAGSGPFEYIAVQTSSVNIPRTLSYIKDIWKSFVPNKLLDYSFMNNDFAAMYRQDHLLGNIFKGSAILAILIACLGLLGLTFFLSQARTKEIGIRKVLGAEVINIVQLLSEDFLRLVLIGIIIAIPVSWWMMNKWLQNFAYRINLSWKIFLLAGLMAIVIALITISFQAIKAAVANPVESLRAE